MITQYNFEKHIIEFKNRLSTKYTKKESDKYFIKTLILKRNSSKEDFDTAIKMALEYNAISYLGVRSILSQLQNSQTRTVLNLNLPNIEGHFSLEKYKELEQQELIYD